MDFSNLVIFEPTPPLLATYLGTAVDTTTASTYQFNSIPFGDYYSAKALLITFHCTISGGIVGAPLDVVIGDASYNPLVTATLGVAQQQNGTVLATSVTRIAGVYSAYIPPEAATVIVTMPSGRTAENMRIGLYSVSGLRQLSASAIDYGVAASNVLNFSESTFVDSLVVYVSAGTGTTTWTGTDVVESYDGVADSGTAFVCYASAAVRNSITSAGTGDGTATNTSSELLIGAAATYQ